MTDASNSAGRTYAMSVRSWRRKIGLLIIGMALAAGLAAAPARASDGSVSTTVIALFPKTMGNFAYMDLRSSSKVSWFSELFDHFVPGHFQQFKTFAAGLGFASDSQVQEIAWGTLATDRGEAVVGVALGQFNPSEMEQRFQEQKLPVQVSQGYKMYAFGSGFGANDLLFLFIDSNTVAFGHRSGLERLIGVHMGTEENLLSNEKMFALIRESNGSGLLWAILDQDHTQAAIEQLVPQAAAFPEATAIEARVLVGLIIVCVPPTVPAPALVPEAKTRLAEVSAETITVLLTVPAAAISVVIKKYPVVPFAIACVKPVNDCAP